MGLRPAPANQRPFSVTPDQSEASHHPGARGRSSRVQQYAECHLWVQGELQPIGGQYYGVWPIRAHGTDLPCQGRYVRWNVCVITEQFVGSIVRITRSLFALQLSQQIKDQQSHTESSRVGVAWLGNNLVNGVNMTNRPVIMDKEARTNKWHIMQQ